MARRVVSGGVFLLILSFAFSLSLEARVYKWVDDDGKIHYSDQPQKKSEKTKPWVSPLPKVSPPKPVQQPKKNSEDFDKSVEGLLNPKGRVNQCVNLADKIEQCLPYTCEMSHPIVGRFMIQHTIAGVKDGKCHYEQTMPKNGLMACNFSERQREQYAELTRDMFSGKTIESQHSLEMKASYKMDSSGKSTSQSRITKENVSYKVDGKKSKNILNEALKNADCVVTGL